MFFWFIFTVILYFLCRAIYIFATLNEKRPVGKNAIKLMAIAGSGGHTSELIRLLSALPTSFSPRYYVIANTDHMSESKLTHLEALRDCQVGNDYFLCKIPRSREVSQSWMSTIYTTFIAGLYSFPILWNSKPDVILCNGPGTCIPLCATSLIFKLLGICWTDIIYVESLCRVTTMSMSGWILYPFANKFFIQWPHLLKKYPKAIYLGGRIV